MTRRFIDEVVQRKASFFVPGGPKGPSQATERCGYVLRERGDVDGAVAHEYRCPIHGRFTAMVSRRDVPDEMPCPLISWTPAGTDLEYPTEEAVRSAIREACGGADSEMELETQRCAATAPWSPSTIGVGKSSGEVAC